MGFVPKTLLFNRTCFPLTRNSQWSLQACQGFFWYFRQHSEKKKCLAQNSYWVEKQKTGDRWDWIPSSKRKSSQEFMVPVCYCDSSECRSPSLEAALCREAPNIPTHSLNSPASSPALWGFQWQPFEPAENFQGFIKMNLNPLSLIPRSSSTGQPLGMHLGSDSIDEREVSMRWEETSALESWDGPSPLQRWAGSCVTVVPMVPKVVHPQRSFTQKSCPLGMFLLILPMTGDLGEKNQKTCSKTFCRNLGLGSWPQNRRNWSFQMNGSQVGLPRNSPANADIRDVGSIPGSGRSPGGEHGKPLQYSCLENPVDRGAWRATVHGVAKSETRLKWLSTLPCMVLR